MLSTDAAVGLSNTALNKGFSKIVGQGGEIAAIELKGKDWKLKGATLGAPRISFLPDEQSKVRMTLPFISGSLVKFTFDMETGKVEEAEHPLDGREVSFETVLKRVDRDDFHDKNFTAQAIYLDLTDVDNIDAMSLGLSADDLSVMQDVMRGVIGELQKKAGGDKRFLVSRVQTPDVRDTSGPLVPTSAALAATCKPAEPDLGELDFLLMLRNRPMPPWAGEHAQRGLNSPLTAQPAGRNRDAVLALSDRALLEAIARPVIESAFKGIKIVSDEAPLPGRLHQVGDLKRPERGLYAKGLEAKLVGTSLHIAVDLVMDEALQTGDGPNDVDFSIVRVAMKKRLTFDIALSVNSEGLLDFEVTEGSGNHKDPKPEFKPNFEVHKFGDMVKYLGILALPFFGPVAGGLVAIFVAGVTAIAQAIQAGIVDSLKLEGGAKTGLGALEGIDTHIQLPGDPVFLFSNILPAPNCVHIGADVLDPPPLNRGTTRPFALAPAPRVEAGRAMPPDRTEPQLIGEVALHYRNVADPRFTEGGRRRMPYYILRREQFWHRVSSNQYPANQQQTITEERVKRVQNTHNETMTKTLKMDVSIDGTLEMLGGFAPEIKAEFESELQVEVSDETERETTDTLTKEIVMEPRDQSFGVAVWVLTDRYSLLRSDSDRTLVAQWDYANRNYVDVDDYAIEEREISNRMEEENAT